MTDEYNDPRESGRDAEIAAIQEGIDAVERGEVRPFEEFDREFRLRNGTSLKS